MALERSYLGKIDYTAVIREHDSQIVFGLEQPSDKLMTVDLI